MRKIIPLKEVEKTLICPNCGGLLDKNYSIAEQVLDCVIHRVTKKRTK